MKLPRRNFLHLAAGAAALPAVSRIARAQAYPTRTITIVIAFPPGGPNEGVVRFLAEKKAIAAQAAAFFSEPEIDHFVMAITSAEAIVRHTARRPWLSDSVSQIT